MNVISNERFEGSSTDFRTQITKLRANQDSLDVLLAINVSGSVGTMFQQINEIGLTTPIISDNWTILNPAISNRENIEGVTFIDYEMNAEDIATQSVMAKSFIDEYKKRFDSYPNTFASNGYDAAKLYAKGLNATNVGTPSEIADYFVNNLGTFEGVNGSISFNDSCEVNRTLTTRQIVNGGIIVAK